MICLDTDYLIRALVPDTPEAARLVEWNANGEFHSGGRRRSSRVDAMIAAAATSRRPRIHENTNTQGLTRMALRENA